MISRLAILFATAMIVLTPHGLAEEKNKETKMVDGLTPLAEFIHSETMFGPESGFTVVFEQEPVTGPHKGDIDIAAQRLHVRNGQILWTSQRSLPVSTSVYTEDHLDAIGDGHGGMFTVYRATAKTGSHADDSEILAQRISAAGQPMWHDGQKSTVVASTEWDEIHPKLVPDGNGGVIVIYQMTTETGQHAGDSDLAARRIDGNGNLVWAAKDGVSVSNSSVHESNHAVLPLADGAVLVVFEARPRSGERSGISGIFAQVISVDGERVWNQGSHPTAISLSTWSETDPVLVSDGDGGAIVVFTQHSITGEHAGDKDLAAQRILADGTVAWNKGEQASIVSDSRFLESNPAVVSDGAGGAIVVYEAEPRSGDRAGNSDIWAQRIGPDGKRMWKETQPVLVATSLWSEKAPSLARDPDGNFLLAFEQHAPRGEHAGDVDIASQKLDAMGKLVWHGGGRAIEVANSSRAETAPQLFADGDGGAILVFQATERTGEHAGDKDLYAQRITGAGELLWNEGKTPTQVASSTLLERNFVVVAP